MTKSEQFTLDEGPEEAPLERPRVVSSGAVDPVHPDAVNLQLWCIPTHACFLTGQHQDSDGLNTFVYIRTGVKFWVVINGVITEMYETREEFFQVWNEIFDAAKVCDKGECYLLILRKGDLL
jgi:hypothetical protein